MNTKRFFRLILLFIGVYAFTSCSQENFSDLQPYSQDESTTTRAVSDIFNVEEIALPENTEIWFDGPRGVDREGNLYVSLYKIDSDPYENIYKYDLVTKTFMLFSSFGDYELPSSSRFCFDENNNLCFLICNDKGCRVRRIRADGNAIADQWINLSSASGYPISMSAALNGNLLILADHSERSKIYRLNTNGVLSEIEIDLSGVGACNAIYKANGNIAYVNSFGYFSEYWYKLNTNTGSVEESDIRVNKSWHDSRRVASSYSKANLYTLQGNYVVQLRPNATSDLVIGTIPNSYKNKDGEFVNTTFSYELFMDPDATVFYVMGGNGFYKLTL